MAFYPLVSVGALLADIFSLLILLIIVEVIISNIIAFGGKLSPYHPIVKTVRSVVNPILLPLRRVLPPPYKTGGWDFAPFLAIILLQVVRNVLFR